MQEWLGAISTAIAVLVAAFAIWWQSHITRRVLGISILRDYDRAFDEDTMIKARLALAEFLLHRLQSNASIQGNPETLFGQHAIVPDFFTTIGLLVKKHILDTEMVWSSYFWWVVHYWQLLREDIYAFRGKEDESYYQNFEGLYKTLVRFDRKYSKTSYRESEKTKEQMTHFLNDEILKCKIQL